MDYESLAGTSAAHERPPACVIQFNFNRSYPIGLPSNPMGLDWMLIMMDPLNVTRSLSRNTNPESHSNSNSHTHTHTESNGRFVGVFHKPQPNAMNTTFLFRLQLEAALSMRDSSLAQIAFSPSKAHLMG